MKKIILMLFALMCLAQWFVPGKMIYDQEKILAEGKLYKFLLAPVDPADPFRGKYITLNFRETSIEIADPEEWKDADEVYVSFYDSAGFARIHSVSMYPPEQADFVKANIRNISTYEPFTLWFTYPFNRFYLEESKAQEAEQQYRQSQSDSTDLTYALISIKDGESAIKDVRINDRSIVDIVRDVNQQKRK